MKKPASAIEGLTKLTCGALMLFVACGAALAQGPSINQLQSSFLTPSDDARIMMRWWWFGPAVTKPELEREMRVMKEGGIGGFEVQPVYPLSLDDPGKGIRNFPFLSDEYIDDLRFVSAKSRELGLRMDLTLGSGWSFGGPQVSIDQAAGMLRSERIKLEADHAFPCRTLPPGKHFSVCSWCGRAAKRLNQIRSMRSPTSATESCSCQRIWPDRPN